MPNNLSICCKDCGKDFWFTVKDQEFYKRMGFSQPKRCKPCRDQRKTESDPSSRREARRQATEYALNKGDWR
jgi:hypothetical protein